MLDDWVLANNLNVVHLQQTLCDLFPGWYRTDIVEHGRRLCKADAFLDLLDKVDASEVHVVLVLSQGGILMNGIWYMHL